MSKLKYIPTPHYLFLLAFARFLPYSLPLLPAFLVFSPFILLEKKHFPFKSNLGSFIYYVCKIFRKTNYQGARNVSFLQNFANVMNEWTSNYLIQMIETKTNFCTLSVNQTDAASLIDLTKVHSGWECIIRREGILSQNVLVKLFGKIVYRGWLAWLIYKWVLWIVFEKPGIFSEKLKTLTSSNYHRVEYFFCWNFSHVCNLPVPSKWCSGFFILFGFWVISKT